MMEALFARFAQDPFARSMGIRLEELGPGHARASMETSAASANFHGSVHGGAIFALADVAFAAASNSHGVPAVALTMEIQYLSPGRPGVKLVAEATEEDCRRRTALYRIAVREAEQGALVALLQGRVYRMAEAAASKVAADRTQP